MEHGSTILIVDDQPAGREILEALLTEREYDLAFASSGAEALAKAAELAPDLILLDVAMPGMDGFEVCQDLRADALLASVPIVMISVLDDRDARLRSIKVGADDFVSKPFDEAELLAHIETIIRLDRYHQLFLANRQLERKITQLSALCDISSALNSTTDINVLLKSIIQKAKELLNVESISIFLWDQLKDELYLFVVPVEETEPWPKQLHFPVASGVAEWVFHEGESALVQDVSVDERFGEEIGDNRRFVVKSVLCVPLRSGESILGILEAVNKKEGEFTAEDRHLLEALANNVTVSIEKANLYRDLQRAEALLRRRNTELRRSVKQEHSFESIIGRSEKIMDVLKEAEQVALTDSTVLIYGETGTGKDLLALAIHQGSPRSSKNFAPINCGAIPENLLETELFGHEKGAFTDATARRIGRYEEADGGTLFLDEIGDMSLGLQVKLLRTLDKGVIQRLGSNKDILVDVRVIAATHENLAELLAQGRFREDLYYRLKVLQLDLPPLRERREDIPLLIKHFMTHYNKRLGKQIVNIEDAVLDILYHYDYPGNIRELQHVIESAMVLCKGDTITVGVLPKEVRTSTTLNEGLAVGEERIAIPKNNEELKIAKARAQRKIERLFLQELLSSTRGNISEAARKAEMNRSWLTELIDRHGLDLKQFWEGVGRCQ